MGSSNGYVNRCTNCGAQLEQRALFCGKCGTRILQKRFCPKCGTLLISGAQFCSECGTRVNINSIINDNSSEYAKAKTSSSSAPPDKQPHSIVPTLPDSQATTSDDSSKNTVIFDTPVGNETLNPSWRNPAFFRKTAVVSAVIAIILLLLAIHLRKGLPIFISTLQLGGLVVAFLMHKGFLHTRKIWLKHIVIVLVAVLSICNFYSFSISSTYSKSTSALTNHAPVQSANTVPSGEPVATPTSVPTSTPSPTTTPKPTPTIAPTPSPTPKATATPKPTETPKPEDESVSYSTNSKSTVKNGDSGVYSYVSSGSYDVYYIIDFDEGYVYYFLDTESAGERVRIVSGNLNEVLIIKYSEGGNTWSYGLHFKWKNQPDHLIVQDEDGFEYDFYSTNLSKALKILESKEIYDYSPR